MKIAWVLSVCLGIIFSGGRHANAVLVYPPATNAPATNVNTLYLPLVGENGLHILSPNLLELTLINTKPLDPATVTNWNFVDSNFQLVGPYVSRFTVTVNGRPVAAFAVLPGGFKRRIRYAPLNNYDLRIGNYLYLQLAKPVANGETVSVTNPDGTLWPSNDQFTATMNALGYNPAIHVNQVGYLPAFTKKAIIGYYLGSLGEMDIPTDSGFTLVDSDTGAQVYQGALTPRPDIGFNYTPMPYQNVYEADFSSFTNSGEYQLVVPGLGASYPFFIDNGIAMAFTRAYALGLYERRSGTNVSLPFTRFTHPADHTAPAFIPEPEPEFTNTWNFIESYALATNSDNPVQIAPLLTNSAAQLFPFVNQGTVAVSGGHFDAGDYSKYTWDSASLVHYLMFAVDSLPGVASLDNLGIPESGDGISDIMEEAKWEADFLARMQDADGGFYYVVYPRDRQYESNVLPQNGDPQVVWPKNTAVTAAAVAALAECASSPLFKNTYPQAASNYWVKAQLGWQFLTNAITKYGKDGAYQKLMSYGDDFTDKDELAWAACEMFLATGNTNYQQILESWFPDPTAPSTFRWGWWRMYACYGNAVRDYAFAVQSGRLQTNQLDPNYLSLCQLQVLAAGDDALTWSQDNAYGTSFPLESKAALSAGWYFSSDQAFDMTVAYQLNPKPAYLDAILRNLNYEGGCNPVNVCFVTGLGWKRQHEIVDQYSQNDGLNLPVSGLPLGNLQTGFTWLSTYGSELEELDFPTDNGTNAPYPLYDRWGDSYNVTTEFTEINLARSLTSLAYWAAQTPLQTQSWTYAASQITSLPAVVMTNTTLTAGLNVPGMSLSNAVVVWDAQDQVPFLGTNFTFSPTNYGSQWVEAEAQWPDGRRVFAVTNFFVTNDLPTVNVAVTANPACILDQVPGIFTFTRTGATTTSLTVGYLLRGTATKWNDYRTPAGDMPTSVTIPAGVSSYPLIIVGVTNSIGANSETVVLTLLPQSSYNVGSASNAVMTVLNNDLVIQGTAVAASRSNQSITITWASLPGKVYEVEYKNDLAAPAWTPTSVNIMASGTSISWTDTESTSVTQRFYRILEVL